MDCARFEDLLFARLEAALDATDEAALRRHGRDCSACRRLQALLAEQQDVTAETPPVPDDLLSGVVARTSGSACDRVAMMLAESIDAPLDARGTLLSAHLDVCPDCAAFARALSCLRIDLPQLADIDPGASFTDAVVAATTGAGRRAARRAPRPRPASPVPEGLAARLEAAWMRLVQRPRFALEGAYAAALLIFLVVGLPSTSFAELPVRAFDEFRRETARVEQALSTRVGEALDRGRETVSDSAALATRYLSADEQESSRAAVASRVRAWTEVGSEMAAGIWHSILGPFADRLGALFADATSDEIPRTPNPDRNP